MSNSSHFAQKTNTQHKVTVDEWLKALLMSKMNWNSCLHFIEASVWLDIDERMWLRESHASWQTELQIREICMLLMLNIHGFFSFIFTVHGKLLWVYRNYKAPCWLSKTFLRNSRKTWHEGLWKSRKNFIFKPERFLLNLWAKVHSVRSIFFSVPWHFTGHIHILFFISLFCSTSIFYFNKEIFIWAF